MLGQEDSGKAWNGLIPEGLHRAQWRATEGSDG